MTKKPTTSPRRKKQAATPAEVVQALVTPKQKRASRRRLFRVLRRATAILLLLLMGIFFQYSSFGMIIIALYGIFALTARVESTITFTMALISFVCIMVLAIDRSPLLAQNFANYAFLLLVIGTISLFLETRRTA